MNQFYEFLSVINKNGFFILFICLTIGFIVASIQKAEIETLRNGLIELAKVTERINQNVDKVAEIADNNFKRIAVNTDNNFENAKQTERRMFKIIEQHNDALRDIQNHLTLMPSENDDLEHSIQEAIAAKERFRRLSDELSVEEFKEKAEEYFEEKIQETYDAIDNSWGDDLSIVCEKQNRFRAKQKKVREASTNKEAFEAMFSPC